MPESQPQKLAAFACVAIGLGLTVTVLGPWDASRSIRAAQESRLQRRTTQSIELAQRATRTDQNRAAYWQGLGLAYVGAGQWVDAGAAFERAKKLAPYDVRAINDQARAQLLLASSGDNAARARAVALADEAVGIDPNNPQTQLTRALAMQFTGNLPEALSSVERAVALDHESTNDRLYVTAMQIYIDSARPADAVRLGRQGIFWLGAEPVSVPVRYELARALAGLGMHQEALSELDQALAIQPANTSIQRLRAEISALIQK
jgi:tetratricopeptide (TPR) repeat protein